MSKQILPSTSAAHEVKKQYTIWCRFPNQQKDALESIVILRRDQKGFDCSADNCMNYRWDPRKLDPTDLRYHTGLQVPRALFRYRTSGRFGLQNETQRMVALYDRTAYSATTDTGREELISECQRDRDCANVGTKEKLYVMACKSILRKIYSLLSFARVTNHIRIISYISTSLPINVIHKICVV